MASNEELDKFRENWKKEVSLKKTLQSDHPAFREDDPRTATSSFNPNISNIPVSQLDFSSESSSTTYYPFNIVGNLLKSSSLSRDKTVEYVETDTITCPSSLGSKRKLNKNSSRKVIGEKKVKLKDVFTDRDCSRKVPTERILDCFLADLDEMNTIPFFDLAIPREIAINIFKHLDVKDLGRCSQVSKSWRSLAEDELLWCNICHRLGYHGDVHAVEKENWKDIVYSHVQRRRNLYMNWKERKSQYQTLQHAHKGILCSVTSIQDLVVAGYTTGEVKMWDLSSKEECVFQPSMSGLMVDLSEEWGTTTNMVKKISVSPSTIAAVYTQGNVDVWLPQDGTGVSAAQMLHHPRQKVQHVCLSQSSPTDSLILAAGPYIQIYHRQASQLYQLSQSLDATQHIKHLDLMEKHSEEPTIVITTARTVKLFNIVQKDNYHRPEKTSVHCDEAPDTYDGAPVSCDEAHITCDGFSEVHNMIDYEIMCTDLSPSSFRIVVGLYDKIKIYDSVLLSEVGTFYGHTHALTCINMKDSPENMFVTGSQDRRVRVYDIKQEQPAITFSGTTSYATTVQMDDWKVVSGSIGGFVYVWDQRMAGKLWELYNRHPVGHCRFYGHQLVVGNIPTEKAPVVEEFEVSYHRRRRGEIQLYDFSTNQLTEGVPEICLSSYDQPLASRNNISLAVPYDSL